LTDKKLGAAVIGLSMGYAHLTGYRDNPHTRIIGICDTDSQLLGRVQKEFHTELAVADYRELLKDKRINIVSVASPDFFHAEQSIAAMEAGKDVLCEKPMTPTIEEGLAIIEAVRKTGRRFMVGQVCRYAPGFVLAKKMVERGEIGELFFVESEYAHTYRTAPGKDNWRQDPRREPFLGGGCHAVDLLRWIAGNAREVCAYSNHKCLTDWPVNDCTVAIYKFERNVIGKVMVSIGCVRPYTMRSVFYGTEGTIVCDNTSSHVQLSSTKNFSGGSPSFATFPVNIASHNVGEEINDFVDRILNDKPVLTNELEGLNAVVTCLAAVESARTGKAVSVKEV